MRKTRSDKGVSRIDWTHEKTSYDQKLRAALRIEKKLERVPVHERAYREYLRTYADNLRKDFTMETLYTKQDFKNIKDQLRRQGEIVNGKEMARMQTLQLTSTEQKSLKQALESLEQDWGRANFDDLTVDTKKELNKYFNMSEKERAEFLAGNQGELFRHHAFAGFASLSRYYQANSPHEQ